MALSSLSPAPGGSTPPAPRESEAAIRRRLGIPATAERVLVLGETSHWDPNWLHTSEEYYGQRIQPIFEEVIEALEEEPRRIFSLESIFFLQLFWERNPQRQDPLRALINSGRLRLTGTGITTPDTLLPDGEAILRDYLLGQEWLRAQGITVEPRLAYLPDDFGHSPFLPALLAALGFEQACVTRIDGMYFVGTDYRRRSAFPLSGSSAALLQEEHRSLDFRWRSPDGSEILCHWNAFTYFQGDMLAHKGIIRWMGMTFGVPWRTVGHVARRLQGFVDALAPLSRTPYLFCPIGCDFNGPLPELIPLLDRHNERHFARTGVFVTCAALDDYLDLVAHHAAALPLLELDPNPCWMGFYASRPQLKRHCHRLASKLVAADGLASRRLLARHPVCTAGASLPTLPFPSGSIAPTRVLPGARSLTAAGWDLAVLSNHHDFITGTSPDRVLTEEQLPWLQQAEAYADRALHAERCGCLGDAVIGAARPPRWRQRGGTLEVTTDAYQLILDEAAGGCLVSLRARPDGEELLAGPANDAVSYRDSGGLWRMGHEYLGGTFKVVDQASRRPATIHAREHAGRLQVRVESSLDGRLITRELELDGCTPLLRLRLFGEAGPRRTVTCRFPTRLHADQLTMDVPGGVLPRPAVKLYRPTFWSARSFVHLVDPSSARGLAAFLGGPACASLTAPGVLECVALRHAPVERAFGLLPLPAHPARGDETGEHALDYALLLTPRGDYRENELPRQARLLTEEWNLSDGLPQDYQRAAAVIATDHPQVLVTAVKRASRGEGIIVRLQSFTARPGRVRLHCPLAPLRAACRCDARERDLEPLTVVGGNVLLFPEGSITSVRLLLR